ncbi:MAG: hypothetical protein AB1861_23150 [Cyanobacteriota bacterium]
MEKPTSKLYHDKAVLKYGACNPLIPVKVVATKPNVAVVINLLLAHALFECKTLISASITPSVRHGKESQYTVE